MKNLIHISPKTHLKKCGICMTAKTSDGMCRDMQAYLDGNTATYQREIPIDSLKILRLSEQGIAHESAEEQKQIDNLIEGLNFGALTLRQRQCLQLYFFEGFTETQIAWFLKISQPTVNREIFNALNTLRKNFENSENTICIGRNEKIEVAKIFLSIMKNCRKLGSYACPTTEPDPILS